MYQFSVKTHNFDIFDLNLRKLSDYMLCFGSNSVEVVGESQVEAKLCLVEVDAAGWMLVELGGVG